MELTLSGQGIAPSVLDEQAKVAADQGRWNDAYRLYCKLHIVIGYSPNLARNMSRCLLNMGRPIQALETIELSISQSGVVNANDLLLFGDCCIFTIGPDRALSAYQEVAAMSEGVDIDLHRVALYSQAFAHFFNGNWSDAWRFYEYRLKIGISKVMPFANAMRWSGQHLEKANGFILVYSEQGLGDTIMMARFYHRFKQRAGSVVFLVKKVALSLLRDSFPDLDIVSDLCVEATRIHYVYPDMSLPFALDATPTGIPYLQRPRRKRFANSGEPMHIGVAWNGSASNITNEARSIDMSLFLSIFEGLNVLCYSLVPRELCDTGGEEIPEHIAVPLTIKDDCSVVAQLVVEMDLVISVDSAPAHLAGALGAPVWTLLSCVSDWRWGFGTSTPWYATMRLFRQDRQGDGGWGPVIQTVRRELEMLLRSKPALT